MSQPPYVNPLPGGSALPRGLDLNTFLQTVVVGLSGMSGTLVRPEWQPEPPKQPDLPVNWIAMGVQSGIPNASAYVSLDENGKINTQRHQTIDVTLSIYGPDCIENYGLISDGFQLPQNRIALYQANMAFTELTPYRRIPDLVNGRWIDRVVCSILFQREVQRVYPILTFLSASGIIYIPDVSEDYQLTFSVTQ